jgi:aminoglycoside phosphotransferase (APT) family kinase protein
MEQAGVYVREARFYAELNSQAGVRAPRSYAAGWEDDGRAFIVIEDLAKRGAELWDCRVARSVADVRAMLDTLSHLHARWWEDPAIRAMPFVDISVRSTGPLSEWPRANGAARLNEVLSGPRGEGLPAQVRDGSRIERAFWRMVSGLEEAKGGCLLHGDPHPGNAFSDSDGAAGLFDWQTVARGPWAFDVGYMIVTALSVEDRRANEQELLAYYVDRLRRLGTTNLPSREDVWREYRRHIAYPMLIWPTNHTTHQSEENIRALTYRLGMAADDFGFFDLWGV